MPNGSSSRQCLQLDDRILARLSLSRDRVYVRSHPRGDRPIFERGELERLHWECRRGNVASLRTAQKVGFRYAGVADGTILGRDGNPVSSWVAIDPPAVMVSGQSNNPHNLPIINIMSACNAGIVSFCLYPSSVYHTRDCSVPFPDLHFFL